MARVKIEEIVDHLSTEFRNALDEGYGKQLDIINSIILEIMSNRFPGTGRMRKHIGEST